MTKSRQQCRVGRRTGEKTIPCPLWVFRMVLTHWRRVRWISKLQGVLKINTIINVGVLFAAAVVTGAGAALGWRAANETIDATAAIIRQRQLAAAKAAAKAAEAA